MDPSRRYLLGRASALAAMIAGGPLLACSAPRSKPSPRQKKPQDAQLFEISLAEWSLNRSLFSGAMSNLDFPRVARERYKLGAVEYVNTFFKDKAADWSYLSELRSRCNDVGVTNLLIMVDGEGQLGINESKARRSAVQNHFRWIAAASFLGCHAIRVNAGGDGTPDEQRDHAADSLRQLADVGDDYNIDVIVENHGGISSNGAWLASVMAAADHPRVGTLPDFGNFRIQEGEWYDRYLGVEELMPWAKAVSAKTHAFDEAGNETTTDYRRMLAIVMEAGYHGHIGIEYEGGGLPEHDGIVATRTLLERVRSEMVTAAARR
ncbi:MAG: L-ribulose-5-phosphate 3-epimerase [Pseudohongiellaceae bacterium]|jgi:L-ribulose-5-phosphate 3-epimerase